MLRIVWDTLDKMHVLSWYCCIALADLGENTNARISAFEVFEKTYNMWESSLN
jgi:hypothetical protein